VTDQHNEVSPTDRQKRRCPGNPAKPFTTLIKGYIDAKDAHRAWKVFDHMRSEVCEPDSATYNAMISACALEQKAERALDLFEEMTQKKLPADQYIHL
jgi:pentatricopeptide repeat protein